MKHFKPIFIREEIIKSIREFFYAKNFHEVIVPVLNDTVPLEQNLYPFSTIWNTQSGNQKLYLSMSPERGLKRMLGMGLGNCFAIGKSFRNLEAAGSQHIPEFLMLEWYREHADYHQIMQDTEELILFIQTQLGQKKLSSDWKTVSLEALFQKCTGLDFKKTIDDDLYLFQYAKKKSYDIKRASWRSLFDQIFVNEVENTFSTEPFFLVDFPAKISPLCTPQKEKPWLAQRFELYIEKKEIANGNTELTDANQVRKSFIKVQKEGGKQPIDETFLQSLQNMQGKQYAGIGLGIDRLAMLFAGVDDIKEVEVLV